MAVALSAALFTSGCVSSTGTKTAQTTGDPQFEGTVEFWTINLKKNYNDYITGLINTYRQQHPKVTITWVDVPGADIATKLLAAIASGKVPDAVNLDSGNLGPFIPSLTPMDQLLTTDDLGVYQPNLLTSLRSKGKLYAVPWYNGGAPVGLYRKSVVSKAGFDPANPPKTYEDSLTLAQNVYNASKVYGMNDLPVWNTMELAGIKLLNDDKTKAAFNTPAAVALVQKAKQAYDAHAIAPGAVSEDTRNYPQSLDNGQLAFSPNQLPFVLLNLQKNSPNIYADVEVTKGMQTPQGKYILQGQQTFVVPKASKHPRAAAEFIKYVTNAANQLAFCKLVTIYPSTKATASDPFFTNITGTTLSDQARQVVVDELPNLVDGTIGSGKDTELTDILGTDVRAAMQGQMSPADALADAEKQWNAKLSGS